MKWLKALISYIDEIVDELKWWIAFNRPRGRRTMRLLSEEALEEYKAGRTKEGGFGDNEDELPDILLDKMLSPEEREAREKGLALVARLEHLYETDEVFRREILDGIADFEAGNVVTFTEENGWSES